MWLDKLKDSALWATLFPMSDDPDEEKLGHIKASPFYYITPAMLIIWGLLIFAIIVTGETMYEYFSTNVLLNGVIISTTVFSLIMVTMLNVRLMNTSRFLLLVDYVMKKDIVTEDDMKALRYSLATDGALLDIKNMEKSIENIADFHHPNFTDKDAMLIKSKFGYRIRNERGVTGFIAGILIMMGLLGTFLGLLTTIDAVGSVLGNMSNLGGDSGAEGMNEFISSLASPLQGMGLAFSSSLFGLCGSLLLGVYSTVAAGAHNRFIEDVSRWIDDRIPKINPKVAKAAKSEHMPPSDDLKSWLSGFVYLATKTHKRLGQLFMTMARSNEQSSIVAKNTEVLCSHTVEMHDTMKGMSELLVAMEEQSSDVKNAMDESLMPILESMRGMNESTSRTNQMIAAQTEASQALLKGFDRQDTHFAQLIESGQQQISAIADVKDTVHTTFAPAILSLQSIQEDMSGLKAHLGESSDVGRQILSSINVSYSDLALSLNQLKDTVLKLDDSSRSVAQSVAPLQKIVKKVDLNIETISEVLANTAKTMEKTVVSQEKAGNTFTGSIEKLTKHFDTILQTQKTFSADLKSVIKGFSGNDAKEKLGDLSRLTWQLNALIDELKEVGSQEGADAVSLNDGFDE